MRIKIVFETIVLRNNRQTRITQNNTKNIEGRYVRCSNTISRQMKEDSIARLPKNQNRQKANNRSRFARIQADPSMKQIPTNATTVVKRVSQEVEIGKL